MKKLLLTLLVLSSPFLGLTAQNIYTIAGDGNQGYSGDGGPATSNFCELYTPEGIYVDKTGNVYIGDEINHVVREIHANGIITTFAGNYALGLGYSGDGGLAVDAQLNNPVGVCGDAAGNIYIADYGNNVIRKVDRSGTISTIAGTGIRGFSGDGGPATAAQLYWPLFIHMDIHNNLYIADLGNGRIRKISALGIISTVAGNGKGGYTADGGLADTSELSDASAACADSMGNIYITDEANNRIRKVNTSGIISTIAGNGTSGYSGDNGLANASQVSYPTDIYIDKKENVFFTDSYNQRIREIYSSSGIINTIAGNGKEGYKGNQGLAINAELNFPTGMSLDTYGNIYFSDQSNEMVREITDSNPLGLDILKNNIASTIYPNPNNGIFTLTCHSGRSEEFQTIVIYNIMGEKVYNALLKQVQGNNTINMINPVAGIYLYRIISQEGALLSSGKFTIE